MSLGDKVASAFGPSAKHNSKNGNDFFGEAYQPWASVCKISDATSNSGNAHPKNQLHSFIVLRISVHSKLIHLRKKMDLWNSLSAQLRIWFIASTYPHEPHATLLFYWFDVRKVYVMFLALKRCLFSHQWVKIFSPTGWLWGRSFSDKMFHRVLANSDLPDFKSSEFPAVLSPRWGKRWSHLGTFCSRNCKRCSILRQTSKIFQMIRFVTKLDLF